MARKMEFENGQPDNRCDNCGAPKYPTLECKRCNE